MSNEEKASKAPKAPKVKFFDGVKAEFKKIIWPDKDTLLITQSFFGREKLSDGEYTITDFVCLDSLGLRLVILNIPAAASTASKPTF